MENNPNNQKRRRGESRIIVAQNLPWLPNWLPLSSCEPARVESNLAALLGVAQRLLGKDYSEWLSARDSQFAAGLQRVQDANMWPEEEHRAAAPPGKAGRFAA